MKNFSFIVLLTVVALAVGGAVFLAAWDIPAQIGKIEKVIPNDKFQR